MTTTNPLSNARLRPIMTGGGGTVLELLLGLATTVTAILAALAWKPPKDEPSPKTEPSPSPLEADAASDAPPEEGAA